MKKDDKALLIQLLEGKYAQCFIDWLRETCCSRICPKDGNHASYLLGRTSVFLELQELLYNAKNLDNNEKGNDL